MRIGCSARLASKSAAAVELARRVSGERLSTWEAAEAIAAEAASAIGAPEIEEDSSDGKIPSRSRPTRGGESSECGLRAVRWPWLRWDPPSSTNETESPPPASGPPAGPAGDSHPGEPCPGFLRRVDRLLEVEPQAAEEIHLEGPAQTPGTPTVRTRRSTDLGTGHRKGIGR